MQPRPHATSYGPGASLDAAVENYLLCVTQPTGVMNPAKLLIALSDELATRLQQTHPRAHMDYTTHYCLLGQEDCLELRMPGGVHNWTMVMLPPPQDGDSFPPPREPR